MVDCFLVTVQAYSSPKLQSLGCIVLCYTNPTSLQQTNGNSLLFLTTLEKAAGLRVQELVAKASN
jgi:hypothetical protein